MPRVKYRDADVALMARMMRAEAEGEGQQGMLYVGNVIVNRAVASCLDFNDVRTIEQVIYQVQGGNYSFEAVQKAICFTNEREKRKKIGETKLRFLARASSKIRTLVLQSICTMSPTWYGQPFTGQFKNHCFYEPAPDTCASVYMG